MAKTDLIGNAGVYWVVSQLSRRNLVALPTVRNCPGADVLVLDPDTGHLGTLQVKTSGKRPNFWPASEPPSVWQRNSHAYVFLRPRTDNWNDFEAFLVPSIVAAKRIAEAVEWHRANNRKPFPCWVLPRDPAEVEALQQAWRVWKPAAA